MYKKDNQNSELTNYSKITAKIFIYIHTTYLYTYTFAHTYTYIIPNSLIGGHITRPIVFQISYTRDSNKLEHLQHGFQDCFWSLMTISQGARIKTCKTHTLYMLRIITYQDYEGNEMRQNRVFSKTEHHALGLPFPFLVLPLPNRNLKWFL